ncbi:MAG: SMI1/KNR4 family protein [Myxococcales bacterium]|nr:SMI1/KNR4 family protein [Myxococcales bacterium]
MSHDIAKAWIIIEGWFQRHAPGAFVPRPPATQAQIDAAEATIGYPLPDDYKQSLLLHDGVEQNAELAWLYAPWLAPIDDCVQAWTDQREYDDEEELEAAEDEPVLPALNHPKRFPILGTAYWDYNVTYVDGAPGPAGKEGQLVTLVSECDFEVTAGSFAALWSRIAELMEQDELEIVRDDVISVVRKADRRALGDVLSEAPPGI